MGGMPRDGEYNWWDLTVRITPSIIMSDWTLYSLFLFLRFGSHAAFNPGPGPTHHFFPLHFLIQPFATALCRLRLQGDPFLYDNSVFARLSAREQACWNASHHHSFHTWVADSYRELAATESCRNTLGAQRRDQNRWAELGGEEKKSCTKSITLPLVINTHMHLSGDIRDKSPKETWQFSPCSAFDVSMKTNTCFSHAYVQSSSITSEPKCLSFFPPLPSFGIWCLRQKLTPA